MQHCLEFLSATDGDEDLPMFRDKTTPVPSPSPVHRGSNTYGNRPEMTNPRCRSPNGYPICSLRNSSESPTTGRDHSWAIRPDHVRGLLLELRPLQTKLTTSNTNTTTVNSPEATDPPVVSPIKPAIRSPHDPAASLTEGHDHSWAIWFQSGKTDINFPATSQYSFADYVKGWIEDLIYEPINWWPLAPRRYPLPDNHVLVDWTCVCTDFHSDPDRQTQRHITPAFVLTAAGRYRTAAGDSAMWFHGSE